ncbi:hypothetical protein ABZ570_08545 [Micromonospora sp. NPDC007271]|uniref:hypothetical protein n=1 Tax=Micromonospora sp. NPDC007271 TaxID=3154587 RepID=UPI0033D4D7C3
MRVLDRLTTAVVALAFILVGLGVPVRGETPEPGAVVAAAHQSIVHDAPSVPPPDGRPVAAPVATPDRPAPPTDDPRAAAAHPGAPSDARTGFSGGSRGDHRAGVVLTDGPDDLLPAAPVRVDGTPERVVAATRYRAPAVPLPPRGTLPPRAPPAA